GGRRALLPTPPGTPPGDPARRAPVAWSRGRGRTLRTTAPPDGAAGRPGPGARTPRRCPRRSLGPEPRLVEMAIDVVRHVARTAAEPDRADPGALGALS